MDQPDHHKRFLRYAERPKQPRTGIRTLDYCERTALLDTYRRLHVAKYARRVESLTTD
jgi:hypothetical protein